MPLSASFLQRAESASDVTTHTFAAQNLGAAAADRIIVVGVAGRQGANRTVVSVTVAGVTATVAADTNVSTQNPAVIAWAAVPTGTSGDVVVQFSGTMLRAGVALWRMVGGTVSLLQAGSSTADPGTVPVNTHAGGYVFATGTNVNGGATIAWTGVSANFSGLIESATTHVGASAAISIPSSPLNVVGDWTNTTASTIGVASFTTGVTAAGAGVLPSLATSITASTVASSVSVTGASTLPALTATVAAEAGASTANPFVITLWSGTFGRIGWIGDPLALRVVERFNDVSTGEITVRSDHPRVIDLTTAGNRVTIDYDPGNGVRRRVLSGPVRQIRGDGPAAGTVTAEVQGDFRLLQRVLGWPVPGNALTSQTSAYDVRSGAAETVLKGYVTANAVTRLGLPVTVATDQGRGATIKVQTRFHALAERLLPAVEEAGLGVSVTQVVGGLLVDVYEPTTYPHVLSEVSGAVRDWAWSVAGPTATRVIAGDQGEATARSFTSTVDAAREAEWRDVIEVFTDARDTDDATTVAQRRADVLAEGAPKRGLRVELAESAGVRYGLRGLMVGSRVTLAVAPGVTITDVLREAVLTWTTDEGFAVTPVVGERSDDPSASLGQFLRSVVRAVRHLGTAR